MLILLGIRLHLILAGLMSDITFLEDWYGQET